MPMLITPSEPAPVRFTPVDLVFFEENAVETRAGRIVSHRGPHFELSLDMTPPEGEREQRVVLSIGGSQPRRLSGRLVRRNGHRVTVEASGPERSEKRVFPRLVAAIGLRWRHVQDDRDTAWQTPDPFMSFSVGGLSFGGGPEQTQEGDLLAVDFQVGSTGPRFAGLARVVRVAPREFTDVEGDETHEISIELIDIAVEAREALAELTLRIQRAMTHAD